MNETSLYDVVRDFFLADGWPLIELSDKLMRTDYRGNNGQWAVIGEIRPTGRQFLCYSVLPENVPADKRQAVAEYITRVNYHIAMGAFQMDFDDGEVRFKTAIDVKDAELTTGLVKQVVYTNIYTFDPWLPGLKAVMEGLAPKVALSR